VKPQRRGGGAFYKVVKGTHRSKAHRWTINPFEAKQDIDLKGKICEDEADLVAQVRSVGQVGVLIDAHLMVSIVRQKVRHLKGGQKNV
jgi:hypothetical protein